MNQILQSNQFQSNEQEEEQDVSIENPNRKVQPYGNQSIQDELKRQNEANYGAEIKKEDILQSSNLSNFIATQLGFLAESLEHAGKYQAANITRQSAAQFQHLSSTLAKLGKVGKVLNAITIATDVASLGDALSSLYLALDSGDYKKSTNLLWGPVFNSTINLGKDIGLIVISGTPVGLALIGVNAVFSWKDPDWFPKMLKGDMQWFWDGVPKSPLAQEITADLEQKKKDEEKRKEENKLNDGSTESREKLEEKRLENTGGQEKTYSFTVDIPTSGVQTQRRKLKISNLTLKTQLAGIKRSQWPSATPNSNYGHNNERDCFQSRFESLLKKNRRLTDSLNHYIGPVDEETLKKFHNTIQWLGKRVSRSHSFPGGVTFGIKNFQAEVIVQK